MSALDIEIEKYNTVKYSNHFIYQKGLLYNIE